MTYTLIQNSSFPNGLCVPQRCVPNPLQPCTGQLSGLEAFYTLGSGAPVGFDGQNLQNVRGISCERWSRSLTFAPRPGTGTSNTTATAYFYFPINSWSNRGESYHRLPKRIQVNGSSARTGQFSQCVLLCNSSLTHATLTLSPAVATNF